MDFSKLIRRSGMLMLRVMLPMHSIDYYAKSS